MPKSKNLRRSSQIPGEYRRVSTVQVVQEFAPTNPKSDSHGRVFQNYVVETVRTTGEGVNHFIEHEGVRFKIPERVVERMGSQKEQTLKEQRRDLGKERMSEDEEEVQPDMRCDARLNPGPGQPVLTCELDSRHNTAHQAIDRNGVTQYW